MSSRDTTQGTVHSVDPITGAGSVLLDDGSALAFSGESVDRSLRMLRVGQRVRLRLEGERVTAVSILTLPLPKGRANPST